MTSMVERIARVIDPEAFTDHASLYAYGIGLGESREKAQRAADGVYGARIRQAMDKALAALREMREPTEVMANFLGTYERELFTAAIDAEIAECEAGR